MPNLLGRMQVNMKNIKLNYLFLFFLLALSACEKEGLDVLLDETDVEISDPIIVDFSGTMTATIGTETRQFSTYMTTCSEEDFYLHTIHFATDYNYVQNGIMSNGENFEISWVTYKEIVDGNFKGKGDLFDGNANPIGVKGDYEISFESVQPTSGMFNQSRFVGAINYIPRDEDISAETSFHAEFELAKVDCDQSLHNKEFLQAGEMWSPGRMVLTLNDGTIQEFACVTIKCPKVLEFDAQDVLAIGGTGLIINEDGSFGGGLSLDHVVYLKTPTSITTGSVYEGFYAPYQEQIESNPEDYFLAGDGIDFSVFLDFYDETSIKLNAETAANFGIGVIEVNSPVLHCQ